MNFFCDMCTIDWWSHTYFEAQLKAMKQIVFFRFGNNGYRYSISIITSMLSLQKHSFMLAWFANIGDSSQVATNLWMAFNSLSPTTSSPWMLQCPYVPFQYFMLLLHPWLPLQHFFNWCCFIFISNNYCFFLFALNVLPLFYGISIFCILLYFFVFPLQFLFC
jgi:hypothetical protein